MRVARLARAAPANRCLGCRARLRPWACSHSWRRPVHFFASSDKAKRVLGWKPNHTFLKDVNQVCLLHCFPRAHPFIQCLLLLLLLPLCCCPVPCPPADDVERCEKCTRRLPPARAT